jgi:hypothetical protein
MVPDLGACWCNSLPPWDDLEFKDWRGVALRMLQEHTTIAVSNAPRKRIPTATAKRANTFTGRKLRQRLLSILLCRMVRKNGGRLHWLVMPNPAEHNCITLLCKMSHALGGVLLMLGHYPRA